MPCARSSSRSACSGPKGALAVIHHTDCGMLTYSVKRRSARTKVQKDSGQDTRCEFSDFLPFADLDDEDREKNEFRRSTQLLNPVHLPHPRVRLRCDDRQAA